MQIIIPGSTRSAPPFFDPLLLRRLNHCRAQGSPPRAEVLIPAGKGGCADSHVSLANQNTHVGHFDMGKRCKASPGIAVATTVLYSGQHLFCAIIIQMDQLGNTGEKASLPACFAFLSHGRARRGH